MVNAGKSVRDNMSHAGRAWRSRHFHRDLRIHMREEERSSDFITVMMTKARYARGRRVQTRWSLGTSIGQHLALGWGLGNESLGVILLRTPFDDLIHRAVAMCIEPRFSVRF